MTRALAPGKIILFGEHAVVYGRPALAVPVTQVHANAEVTDLPASKDTSPWQVNVRVEAPDIGLSTDLATLLAVEPRNPLAEAVTQVLPALQMEMLPPLLIRVSSTIPIAAGLGSGAAVSVAVMRALSAHLGMPLPDERVSELAFEVEKLHHGTPSGIDNTVIAHAAPVFFVKGQPVETLKVGAPFTLVIGDTGIPAPTKDSVGDVARLFRSRPALWEKIFDQIGNIALQARAAIESGAVDELGPLMDENQKLLRALTVSSADLERLVEAAHKAGALGAKLSGGGRGGNMIALARKGNAPEVAGALEAAGAVRTIITVVK